MNCREKKIATKQKYGFTSKIILLMKTASPTIGSGGGAPAGQAVTARIPSAVAYVTHIVCGPLVGALVGAHRRTTCSAFPVPRVAHRVTVAPSCFGDNTVVRIRALNSIRLS